MTPFFLRRYFCEYRKKNRAGWILYDGACPACKDMASRFEGWARRLGYEPIPLQTPWIRERLKMDEVTLLAEMRVLTKGGVLYGGANALTYLAGRTKWARPAAWFGGTRMGRTILDTLYKAIAAQRHCLGGRCRVEVDFPRKKWHQTLFAAAGLYNLLWIPFAFYLRDAYRLTPAPHQEVLP